MNNEIKVFSNEEFGSIRRVEIDGEYWLSGKDVAQALGYAKPENALSAHVDDEDKTTTLVQGTGSNYKSKATVINESGLYSLVLSSKLPSAKKFKRWVTSEVLPSVRKHGAYMTPETLEAAILNPDYLLKVATALKAETDKRKALEAKVSADAPKVLFADSVAASSSTVLVGELAKDHAAEWCGHGRKTAVPVDAGQWVLNQAQRHGLQHAYAGQHGAGALPYQGNGHQSQ